LNYLIAINIVDTAYILLHTCTQFRQRQVA